MGIERMIDELVAIILMQEKELKCLRGESNGDDNTSGGFEQK